MHEEEIQKNNQETSKIEDRPLLWKKLRKLSDEQCNLLLLRYKYQHSVKEIAQILEIPEGTVKSRLFKCIQDISKNIKNTQQ
jgi:RNA polymerase sigma-70 factor (ECF subfamily)